MRSRRSLFSCCLTVLFLAACGLGTSPATPTAAPPSPEPTAPVTPAPSGPDPTSPAVGESGCPVTAAGSASQAATLTLGPGNGVEAPAQTEKPEEPLVIVGTVYDETCAPMAGVSLNVWQTNGDGVYGPGQSSNELQCCYLMGTVRTDAEGRFQLVTVRPGHYKDASPPPPAHIHVELEHRDIDTQMTEIVFADDPHLPSNADRPAYVVTTLTFDPALAALFGIADIVVERNAPASAAALPSGRRAFAIVPGESEATYQISEKFADWPAQVTAVGVTRLVEGTLAIGTDGAPQLHELALTVDLRGLRTDDPQRDEKLAENWLVTNEFPYASFTASQIVDGPAAYQEGGEVTFDLQGDLTIRDVTRPVAFDVTASLEGDTIRGSALASIRMTDFGIDPPNLLDFVKVEDEVLLTVTLTAREGVSAP